VLDYFLIFCYKDCGEIMIQTVSIIGCIIGTVVSIWGCFELLFKREINFVRTWAKIVLGVLVVLVCNKYC
jgi:hypothetical protein